MIGDRRPTVNDAVIDVDCRRLFHHDMWSSRRDEDFCRLRERETPFRREELTMIPSLSRDP